MTLRNCHLLENSLLEYQYQQLCLKEDRVWLHKINEERERCLVNSGVSYVRALAGVRCQSVPRHLLYDYSHAYHAYSEGLWQKLGFQKTALV